MQICSICREGSSDIFHHELEYETWEYKSVCVNCAHQNESQESTTIECNGPATITLQKPAKRRRLMISRRAAVREQLDVVGGERLQLGLTRMAKSIPSHLPFIPNYSGSSIPSIITVPRFDEKVYALGESRYKDRTKKLIDPSVKLFNVQRMFQMMHERRKLVEIDEFAQKLWKCAQFQREMKERRQYKKHRSRSDDEKLLKDHISLDAVKELRRIVKEDFLTPIMADLAMMKAQLPKSKQGFTVSPEMINSVIDARCDNIRGDSCQYISTTPLTSKQVKRNLAMMNDEPDI